MQTRLNAESTDKHLAKTHSFFLQLHVSMTTNNFYFSTQKNNLHTTLEHEVNKDGEK